MLAGVWGRIDDCAAFHSAVMSSCIRRAFSSCDSVSSRISCILARKRRMPSSAGNDVLGVTGRGERPVRGISLAVVLRRVPFLLNRAEDGDVPGSPNRSATSKGDISSSITLVSSLVVTGILSTVTSREVARAVVSTSARGSGGGGAAGTPTTGVRGDDATSGTKRSKMACPRLPPDWLFVICCCMRPFCSVISVVFAPSLTCDCDCGAATSALGEGAGCAFALEKRLAIGLMKKADIRLLMRKNTDSLTCMEEFQNMRGDFREDSLERKRRCWMSRCRRTRKTLGSPLSRTRSESRR
jgi:hypothetical protein